MTLRESVALLAETGVLGSADGVRSLISISTVVGEARKEGGALEVPKRMLSFLQDLGFSKSSSFRTLQSFRAWGWVWGEGDRIVGVVTAKGIRMLFEVGLEWCALQAFPNESKEEFGADVQACGSLESLTAFIARLCEEMGPEIEVSEPETPSTEVVRNVVPPPPDLEEAASPRQVALPLTGGTSRKRRSSKTDRWKRAVAELEGIWNARMRVKYPKLPVSRWSSGERNKARQTLQSYSDPVVLHGVVRYLIENWEAITKRHRWINAAYPSLGVLFGKHKDFAAEMTLVSEVQRLESDIQRWQKENPHEFAPPDDLMSSLREAKGRASRAGLVV